MKICGLTVSEKLAELADEVQSLNPEQPLKWEKAGQLTGGGVVESSRGAKAAETVIRLSGPRLEEITGEEMDASLEMNIAHELLHIWSKRKGYPRILLILSTEIGVNEVVGGNIEDLVEHKFVLFEVKRRGFDLSGYFSDFDQGFYNWPHNDPEEVRGHFLNAFRIAHWRLYMDPREETVRYLESNFPNTFKTAMRIKSVVDKFNPVSPDSSRRCMIGIIRLLDEITGAVPPFNLRFGLDLVLSERQLSSPASAYVSMRLFRPGEITNENNILQLFFIPDGFFFATLLFPGEPEQAIIASLSNSINNASFKELLDINEIRYTVR